jgi:hypothetical protein
VRGPLPCRENTLVMLDHGQIVEKGTHEELRASCYLARANRPVASRRCLRKGARVWE